MAEHLRIVTMAAAVMDVPLQTPLDPWSDFERLLFRRSVRRRMSSTELRKLFDTARSFDATAALEDFLIWSHQTAAKLGNGITSVESVFKRYDHSAHSGVSDGTLDAIEFYRLAEDMGFGELADDLYSALDYDGGGSLSYREICVQMTKAPVASVLVRKFLASLAFDGARASGRHPAYRGFNPMDFAFKDGDAEALRQAVHKMLAKQHAGVADLFEYLSADRARREFGFGHGARIKWSLDKKEVRDEAT